MSRDVAVTHKIMSSIHSRDTRPELMMRKALFASGLRFRVNYKGVPGKPDIAFTKAKLAIFVDGDFWHAHGHEKNPGEQIHTNTDFWTKKLRRNVERDKEVNQALLDMGWIVLRYWESDIKKKLNSCIDDILQYIPKSSDNFMKINDSI